MAATTIIAIDDDRSARETVVVAVERLNERRTQPLELLLARTGLEGINVLRVQPATSVGLVILDIHLPGADIDGRLIGPFIRETFPDLPILPFTGDRDTTVAAQLVALGMEPPVIKPIAPDGLAERIAHSLTSRQKTVTSPVPLQPFLADQARQLVGLLQQRRDAQTIHVALFAQDHLALSGLQHIVSDLVAQQLLAISIASRQATPIVEAIRANQVDLLLCAPDALTDAARITATHGVPLLIYASASAAGALLDSPHSLVVGPTSTSELAHAIERTVHGETYRNAEVAAVLGLSPRQYTIITMLLRGATTTQIAAAVSLSEHRLRHIISTLYDQLGLVHSRAALVQWAQRAPLQLLER